VTIDRIILREISLPFVHFFETSFSRVYNKQALLVQVEGEGITGWGECAAAEGPFYSAEDLYSARHVISWHIVPTLFKGGIEKADRFPASVRFIRGNPMAKAAVEAALFDWESRRLDVPLWEFLGGVRRTIPCGVSIGIQDSPQKLLAKIQDELDSGYRRIKLKIKPGWDLDILKRVRDRFPDVPLMVDANGAYGLEDFDHLAKLDEFRLLMIEQPLFHDDLIEHSRLQRGLNTPLCLDESIRHLRDARLAIELEACRVINIKIGRVGGILEAKRIHEYCLREGVPVWCGGMLETGIGRAVNVAISTLENFMLPGDVSASRRYFERDTIVPPVEVTPEGVIEVSTSPGFGYETDLEWIEEVTVQKDSFSRE
jgi:O-succinylbenzoate synthase